MHLVRSSTRTPVSVMSLAGFTAELVRIGLIFSGTALVLAWAWPRALVGFSFVSNMGPVVEEPTWNLILKILYWTGAAILYYYAFEIFLIVAFIQAALLVRKIGGTMRDAMRDEGLFTGFFKGLWRVAPVLFEPLFFGYYRKYVEARIVQNAPANSSLMRYLEDLPEMAEGDPPGGRLKIVRAVDEPDKDMLQKYEGKKPLPLPGKTNGNAGFKPGVYYLTEVVVDHHKSVGAKGNRPNEHYDVRVKHPVHGGIYSFVSKHMELPELGKPMRAIQSDVGHGHRSMTNPAIIPLGEYGAGTSKAIYQGRAIVWIDPDSKHLHMMWDNNNIYAVIENKGSYMMVKTTDSPKGGKAYPFRERTMVFRDMSKHPEKIPELMRQGYAAEVKIDGSLLWGVKDKKGDVYLSSNRAQVEDGQPIGHGDGYRAINRAAYIPGFYEAMDKLPRDTAFMVEAASLGRGTYASKHQRVAGILNSNVVDAWLEQERNGRLVPKILKVERYGGKDVSGNAFDADEQLRKHIKKQTDSFFHMPKAVKTPEAAVAEYERQKAHDDEGLVLVHRTDPSKPRLKFKIHETWDFRLAGIGGVDPLSRRISTRLHKEISANRNPGSKWLIEGVPQGAGYVMYRTEQGSLGKAGSGLTDVQRRDLWENPEKYLGKGNVTFRENRFLPKDQGRVPVMVEVKGMSQFRHTGVVRAPVVVRFRDDK
jgi:hypothetical protein